MNGTLFTDVAPHLVIGNNDGHKPNLASSDDRYTPPWVFERMGLTFDLDVRTPVGGIPWIPAARYFTIGDDGLSQPWSGRVWMNPPFSRPSLWVRRFIDHRPQGCDGVAEVDQQVSVGMPLARLVVSHRAVLTFDHLRREYFQRVGHLSGRGSPPDARSRAAMLGCRVAHADNLLRRLCRS